MPTLSTNRLLPALLLCLFVASFVSTAFGCYLRTCPVGGKRSVAGIDRHDNVPFEIWPIYSRKQHACPACGPGYVGTCIGAYTCCIDGYGCIRESTVCRKESRLTTPCTLPPKWSLCRSNDRGHCVAYRTCCTSEGACQPDDDCLDR